MNLFERFGIVPNDVEVYKMAFMHGSYGVRHDVDYTYERLEFLGDSVLNLLVSEYLYNKYPDYEEGQLTKLRANYVCQSALIFYSQELGLDKELKICLDDGDISHNEVLSVIADIFESFLGAIFLDQGMDFAKDFISGVVFKYIDVGKVFFFDYKSLMKEYGDSNEVVVDYEMLEECGVPHDKTFKIAIFVDGEQLGVGVGKSKKDAEQEAARKAVDRLDVEIRCW